MNVLLFSAAIVIATSVLFGLTPAWGGFRHHASSALRHGGATGETPSRRLFGKSLVVAQIALAIVLLSAAGLFTGDVLALRSRDLGFEPRSVLLVTLDPSRSGLAPAQLAPLYETLLSRLQSIPGVTAATLCAVSPIDPGQALRFVTVPGFQEAPEDRRYVSLNWIAPDYFEVVRTPTPRKAATSPPRTSTGRESRSSIRHSRATTLATAPRSVASSRSKGSGIPLRSLGSSGTRSTPRSMNHRREPPISTSSRTAAANSRNSRCAPAVRRRESRVR